MLRWRIWVIVRVSKVNFSVPKISVWSDIHLHHWRHPIISDAYTPNPRTKAIIRSFRHDRLLILHSNKVRCVHFLCNACMQCTSRPNTGDRHRSATLGLEKRGKMGRLTLLTARCSWSALGGVLVTGVNAGGPPVVSNLSLYSPQLQPEHFSHPFPIILLSMGRF